MPSPPLLRPTVHDRLGRDRPDLLERVNAGELRPKTAARLAGILNVPSRLERIKRERARLTPQERAELRRWLDEQ